MAEGPADELGGDVGPAVGAALEDGADGERAAGDGEAPEPEQAAATTSTSANINERTIT